VPTRALVLGVAFVVLSSFIIATLTLSSGSDDEEGNSKDAARNSDASRNTTDVTATPDTTGGAALANLTGEEVEEALGDMTIQPNDLPSGFVLQEEKFYTREELFQRLPTITQVAEEGLKYALHRSFIKDSDTYPEKVEVFTYVYEDAPAATAAHGYLRAEGAGAIATRLNEGQEPHDYSASYSGPVEVLGEDSVSYNVVINTQSPAPIHALVFGMRHANVRAEVAAEMRANPYLLPDDVARSQLLRIERGSLTSTVD
jgi:hypothetical protein